MKRYIIFVIVVGVILIGWMATWTNTTTYTYEVKAVEKIEEPVIKPITLRAELIPICACESTGNKFKTPTHFDKDGNVLRGKINPKDVGVCQINTFWNGAEAEKMGLDLLKEKDNITFANYLYQTQGSTPWDWSRHCWQ